MFCSMSSKGCSRFFSLLSCPFFVCSGIAGVSIFSLAAAFAAQYGLGLEPCLLCLYQRMPFVLTALFGVAGLICAMKAKSVPAAGFVGLSSVAFAVNAAIAFYHSGVERHWWRSAFEACRVGALPSGDSESLLDKIMKTPDVPCDSIPWADPILGLSMANYNAMMCAGLAAGCFLCAILIVKKSGKGAQGH